MNMSYIVFVFKLFLFLMKKCNLEFEIIKKMLTFITLTGYYLALFISYIKLTYILLA